MYANGSLDDMELVRIRMNAAKDPDKHLGALIVTAHNFSSKPELLVEVLGYKDHPVYKQYREVVVAAIARAYPSMMWGGVGGQPKKTYREEVLQHEETAEASKYIEHVSYNSDDDKLEALGEIAAHWKEKFFEHFMKNESRQAKVAFFFKFAATIPYDCFGEIANFAIQHADRNVDKDRLWKMRLDKPQRELMDSLLNMRNLLQAN